MMVVQTNILTVVIKPRITVPLKRIFPFQVVLQRNLPGTPDEEEKKGPLQLEAQHIQIIQIVVVFLLVLAV